MKSRLKCTCIDCGKEEQLYWRDSWHIDKKSELFRRKYYWRRGGAKRWLKIQGLEMGRMSGFQKAIQAIVKLIRGKK